MESQSCPLEAANSSMPNMSQIHGFEDLATCDFKLPVAPR
jgi:hypothetical protein